MSIRYPEWLTPQQEQTIRQALSAGATRDEAAAAAGITRSRIDTRMRDQLADLRVGRGRRERHRQKGGAFPTPEEIRMATAMIRAGWSEERWIRGAPDLALPSPSLVADRRQSGAESRPGGARAWRMTRPPRRKPRDRSRPV